MANALIFVTPNEKSSRFELCLSVGWLFGQSVGLPVNISLKVGRFTSIPMSEHLLLSSFVKLLFARQ